ncbi:MAG: 3-dehydroquinate synthase, partial [Rhodospirillaceae bacterium]
MSGDVTRVRVELDERGYDINIGPGLIAGAGARIAPLLSQPRAFVITDANVAGHWLATLTASLGDAGIAVESKTLPAGEQTKSWAYVEELTHWLLDAGIDRRTTLIALGGGVIGDLVGFVAAITLRGIPFIQVPTTLLAQVDSSVGGKTAIDTPQGKNLVGAFHQPRLVLADTGTLDTLPRRQVLAGYAETVKYGLIGDPAFFEWCEANAAKLINGDTQARRHAIEVACRAKAAIVAADEREAGDRALLNLGHTFAHAFEAETGFGETLLHGEAVALGCHYAFELSRRLELCSGQDAERVRVHLAACGLPTGLDGLAGADWTPALIRGHMAKDKKVE